MLQNIGHIENIIFDLGGVILNIDPFKTVAEMKKLGLRNFDAVYAHLKQTHTLDNLEKGLISQRAFLDDIKAESDEPVSDEQVLKAWNALLIDFPRERIRLLEQLQKDRRFRTFLLSNTNAIHYQVYTRMLQEQHGIEGLEALFDRAYFSHEMHMRKPDAGIYARVLEENAMDPKKTLFIDDSKANIEAARALGIEGYHLEGHTSISDLFPEHLTAR